jgi:hypothetical protein
VREHAQDVLLADVLDQLVHVAAKPLEIVVLRLGDPVGEHVDDRAVLRESRRDLLGDEGVGQVRDVEAALDRVVVGDGHQRHATPQ